MRTDPSCLEGCGGEHTQLFVLLPTPHTLLMAVVAAAVATVVVPSCLSLWLVWDGKLHQLPHLLVLARHILKPLVDFSCNELLKMIFFIQITHTIYCPVLDLFIKNWILMKPIRQLQKKFPRSQRIRWAEIARCRVRKSGMIKAKVENLVCLDLELIILHDIDLRKLRQLLHLNLVHCRALFSLWHLALLVLNTICWYMTYSSRSNVCIPPPPTLARPRPGLPHYLQSTHLVHWKKKFFWKITVKNKMVNY